MQMKKTIQEAFNKLGVSPNINIDLDPDMVRYGEISNRIQVILDIRSLDNKNYHIDKFYPMDFYDNSNDEEICKSLIYTYLRMLMEWD